MSNMVIKGGKRRKIWSFRPWSNQCSVVSGRKQCGVVATWHWVVSTHNMGEDYDQNKLIVLKKKYIIIIHTLKVPKHFLSNNIHVAYFNISKVFSQSLNNILIDWFFLKGLQLIFIIPLIVKFSIRIIIYVFYIAPTHS